MGLSSAVFVLVLRLFAAAAGTRPDALAVVAELDRMAGLSLWPGFEPRAVPMLISDGVRTLLLRHPDPPPEFQSLPGRPDVLSVAGRHPRARANTAVELSGRMTATLLLEGHPERSAREWAATLLHETFHVHQAQRHPDWTANEASLFVYPVDDPELLALRRLETELLRRALRETEPKSAACWTRGALASRRERFARMSADARDYERGAERKEGLAEYVERSALGRRDVALPVSGFPAEDVRARAYAVGSTLAFLLDRFAPSWKGTLEEGDAKPLDALLEDAVREGAEACGLRPEEADAIRGRARRDAAAVGRQRVSARRQFSSAPGWRLVILAGREPLWPRGFDPSQFRNLGGGSILHTRWIQLGNGSAALEVLDRPALSEAAGEHPLFQGVRRLTITGLPARPELAERNGKRTLRAEGLQGELQHAGVEETPDRTITVRLE